MRINRTVGGSVLAVLLAVTAGTAQDTPPPADKTAPPAKADADSVPGNFRAFVVTDERFAKGNVRNRAGKMHCFVVENGLNPVCAVFARAVPPADDAPLSRLLKQLSGIVLKTRASNSAAFVTFLTLDKEYHLDETRSTKADEVRGLAAQLKSPGVTFSVAAAKDAEPGEAPAPPAGAAPSGLSAWKIGDKDDIVVVVYNRMRVVKRWTFTVDKPPTDEDIKAIVDAFEKEANDG